MNDVRDSDSVRRETVHSLFLDGFDDSLAERAKMGW